MVIQTVFGVDALMKAMVPQRCFFLVPGPSEDSKTVNVLKCLGQKKTHTHTLTIYICMYIYNIVYIYIIIYIHIHTLGGSRHDET